MQTSFIFDKKNDLHMKIKAEKEENKYLRALPPDEKIFAKIETSHILIEDNNKPQPTIVIRTRTEKGNVYGLPVSMK